MKQRIRNKRVGAALLAGILLLTGCGNSAVATEMRLTKSEGTVGVWDGGGEDISIIENMDLYSGYHVDTETESHAWISLDEVKLAKMDEDSEVELQKNGKNLEILVNSGSLFFHVTKPLEEEESMDIRTSTMVVGIRGTCGWVHVVDERHMQVYILEGTVQCEVTDPESGEKAAMSVSAGEMADLYLYPDAPEGDRCEIQKKEFYRSDIPGFVLEETDLEALGVELPEEDAEEQEDGNTEEQAEESAEGLLEPVLQVAEYESFGMAKNGVMPVQKDGLWGAVNYRNEVVVPFEYTGFQAPDELGNFVLIDTGQNIYTLFDSEGTVLYQGEDPVRASGGMYILFKRGEEAAGWVDQTEYYGLDGTLVQSLSGLRLVTFNGFYDGISMVYRWGDDSGAMESGENVESHYSAENYEIGEVNQNGGITWHEDPIYVQQRLKEEEFREAMERERASSGFGWEANVGGVSYYLPRIPLGTVNHGYYYAESPAYEPGMIALCSDNYELIAECYYYDFWLDSEQGVVYGGDNTEEMNSWRGFYHDGAYLCNYGPNIVFIIGDKDVLMDFSLYPGMTSENADSRVVKAVYDGIYMSNENYWLVKNGDMWGYIDHDGREAAMFEDASTFYKQHAVVLEDGIAYLINEDFEKIQELGEADSVGVYGDLFMITREDTKYFYQLK